MSDFFNAIPKVVYEGPESNNLLAYRYYDANKMVLGKSMQEHLRLAVCAWHNFVWSGHDIFGADAFVRPWLASSDPMTQCEQRVDALFEFTEKLDVPFFTFHDRDLAPEGKNLSASNDNLQHIADRIAERMQTSGKKLLWGTANLFSHRRYIAGAATNPDHEVFMYAVGQAKKALEVTQQLNGENYVFWGGREGYETLLNTDMAQEADQLARFFHMIVDYKHKIGFKGDFLIEPKPCEPTKHQYDYDTATVFAFLQKYGLEKEFKVNIEGNHATLAGHSFSHEVAYAYANDIFGSVDANIGDPQLGWDMDYFPVDLTDLTQVMYEILQHGGFDKGGFNFDTKVRRQSIEVDDLFHGHIGAIDTLARALMNAADLVEKDQLNQFVTQRYAGWSGDLGKAILSGEHDVETISKMVIEQGIEPQPVSGRQEMLQNIINRSLK
jgi:xylose isomerase